MWSGIKPSLLKIYESLHCRQQGFTWERIYPFIDLLLKANKLGLLSLKLLTGFKKIDHLSDFDQNFNGLCCISSYHSQWSNPFSTFSKTLMIRCPVCIYLYLVFACSKQFWGRKFVQIIKDSYYPGASHVRIIFLLAHLCKKTVFG